MSSPSAESVRTLLRQAALRARKERDRSAASVYGTALSAMDNAEAAPIEHDTFRASAIEEAPVGAGAAEVDRRELTEDEMVDIVTAEIAERHSAADDLVVSRPDSARSLRREASLLEAVLAERPRGTEE